MSYWDLVAPYWDPVSIYHNPDLYLHRFEPSEEVIRILFIAHWCQVEIQHGGFERIFRNNTGALVRESIAAFRAIGMPQTAELIFQSVRIFGPFYPLDQTNRCEILDVLMSVNEKKYLFDVVDEGVLGLMKTENGGFQSAANKFSMRWNESAI